MARVYYPKFLIVFTIFEFSESFLTNTKLNLIESINEEFCIRHLNIIKDYDFETDHKILFFIKKLSEKKIYTSALSVMQMNHTLHEYYYSSYKPSFKEAVISGKNILEKRSNLVYPPKTLVIFYGENLKEIISQVFTPVNEIGLSKFTWLIVDNFNESDLSTKKYYIPYNSQLLILKKFTNKRNYYLIEEFYHPSIDVISCFNRHFGIWEKGKGIEIFEPDIYQRRFDMNGTIFVGYEFIEGEYRRCTTYKWTQCLIMHEIVRIQNFEFFVRPNVKKRKFHFEWLMEEHFVNFRSYYSFHMDPYTSSGVYLHIAYDKKYEQHGTSILLRPFSFNLWLALLGCIGLSTISLAIVYCFTDHSVTQLLNGVYEPLESFFNQCGFDSPEGFSFRIASLTSRFTAFFLVPAYMGAILSFILLPKFEYPFKDIKEFVEDGSYRLGYTRIFKDLDLYPQMTNDLYLKIAYENFSVKVEEDENADAFINALFKMCEDHKFAFLHYETIQNWIDKIPGLESCKIIKTPSPMYPGWATTALRHGSPYLKIFNRILKTIRSSGVLKKFLNLYTEVLENKNPITRSINDNISSVEISSIKSIFVAVLIFYLMSVIMIVGEIVFNKIKH